MKPVLTASLTIVLSIAGQAEGITCWIRCHNPPRIESASDLLGSRPYPRTCPNPPLNFLARSSGILTTYAGKLLGIQGWKDYHLLARVSGRVVQAVGSDDGLYTIDLQIKELEVNDQLVDLKSSRFIRVEIFPFVRIGAWLPVYKDNDLCIKGALMWDADGFLEIHPKKASDILPQSCDSSPIWAPDPPSRP
jgi:hypothetical protein